jgi:hypothetical protein
MRVDILPPGASRDHAANFLAGTLDICIEPSAGRYLSNISPASGDTGELAA